MERETQVNVVHPSIERLFIFVQRSFSNFTDDIDLNTVSTSPRGLYWTLNYRERRKYFLIFSVTLCFYHSNNNKIFFNTTNTLLFNDKYIKKKSVSCVRQIF
jgi:hypothetical protein